MCHCGRAGIVRCAVRAGVTQTLYFDPATARIVEEHSTWPGGTFISVTANDEGIVTAIPADVQRYASTSGTCLTEGAVAGSGTCANIIYRGAPGATADAAPGTAAPVPGGGN